MRSLPHLPYAVPRLLLLCSRCPTMSGRGMMCGGCSATKPATADIQAIADQVGGLCPTEPGSV